MKRFFIICLVLCFPVVALADTVVLQLRWDHQFQFAGYYAALWQGYYKEAGIEVEIRSAITPDGDILQDTEEVASGRADFGIGAANILIANEKLAPMAVLASVFQESAARFYRLSPDYDDKRVSHPRFTPRSLLTSKVAREVDSLIDVELQQVLFNEGIDPDLVKPYPHHPELDDLISGAVDIIPGYSISSPFMAMEAGVALEELDPKNFGVNFYGDSLFARRDYVSGNPELAERFVTASMKGWQYALENPQEIAQHIVATYDRQIPLEDALGFNLFQSEGVKKLMYSPVVEPGHSNPFRWQRMHAALKDAGLLSSDFDPQLIVDHPSRLKEIHQEKFFRYVAYVAGIFAAVLVTVFLWIRQLRMQVRKSTLEIQEKSAHEHQAKQRYINLVEKLGVGVAVYRQNERGQLIVEEVNQAGLDMSGRRIDDVIGKTVEDAFPGAVKMDIVETMKRVRETGEAEDFDSRYYEDDIVRGVYKNYIYPLGDDEVVAVFEDVTKYSEAMRQLKLSEERYRLLLDSTAEAIYGLDDNGICTFVNQACLNILGYASEDQLVGKKLHDIIHHTNQDGTPNPVGDCKIFRSFQRSECIHAEKDFLWRADGTSIPVEFWSYPLIENNKQIGAVVSFLDISERISQKKELEEKNKDLEQFVYAVSHDLKTPLVTISGFLGILEERIENREDPEVVKTLATIRAAVTRMSNLLKSLLNHSRSGFQPGDIEKFDAKLLIDDVIKGFQSQIFERNLEIDVATDLPKIKGSRDRIWQVFHNLLDNAIKYSDPQEMLSIEIGHAETSRGDAFFVRDNGPGIPEDSLEKVFNLFERTDTKIPGSGVGLALVKRVVELHGGKVWVELNQPEPGITVWFTLPG